MAFTDINLPALAAETARLIFQSSARTPFDTLTNQTATENDGDKFHLERFVLHPQAREIVLVTLALSPSSSAGVYSVSGGALSGASAGMFLPAGGGYLYLFSFDEIKQFRMRANAAGTITWSATAYRIGR